MHKITKCMVKKQLFKIELFLTFQESGILMFCKFTKLEMYFMLIVSVFYFMLNIKTSLWYPLPWCDEIMYTDPSVNFVLGNGFTSTAWPSISSDSFWSGNCPLYQFILIPWIYCFGIGPTQVRSLNVINIIISNVFIIIAMRRFGLFKSFYTICFFSLLVFCGIGLAHMARDGRPDSIRLLVASIGLFSYTAPIKYRAIFLVLAGMLFIPAGLQLIPLIIAGYCATLVYFGKSILGDHLRFFIGISTGGILLIFLYFINNSLVSFISNTFASGITTSGDIAQIILINDNKVWNRVGGRLETLAYFYTIWTEEFSTKYYIIFCFFSVIFYGKKMASMTAISFCICICILAPIFSLLMAKYIIWYSWVGAIPLYLAVCLIFDNALVRYKYLIGGFLLLISFASYPMQLFSIGSMHYDNFKKLEEFAEQNIYKDDCIYSDDVIYYFVKPKVLEYYSTGYAGGRGFPDIPQIEKSKINVLFQPIGSIQYSMERLGGVWEDTGHGLVLFDRNEVCSEYVLFRRKQY